MCLGIDPSASERRRSGLAVLDSDLMADSWTAATDEEILTAAEKIRPDVVAIDSPLSLLRSFRQRDHVRLVPAADSTGAGCRCAVFVCVLSRYRSRSRVRVGDLRHDERNER